MNWLEVLGKPFTQVADRLRHNGLQYVFDPGEVDDSVENRLTTAAPDKSWEMTLGIDERIEVIFLYPARGARLPHALDPSHTREQVRSVMGTPSFSGEESSSPLLGRPTSAWDRFDNAEYVTHVEYFPHGPIAMVTLMVARVAPGGT